MHTSTSAALAALLALGSVCASAQTTPPAGNEDTSRTAPERTAGSGPQNPSVNGYKDSQP